VTGARSPWPGSATARRLSGAWRSVRTKHYVAATAPDWLAQSPFAGTAERLRGESGRTVHDLPTGHNVMAAGPDRLRDLVRLLP
jgi:hypothetical protein